MRRCDWPAGAPPRPLRARLYTLFFFLLTGVPWVSAECSSPLPPLGRPPSPAVGGLYPPLTATPPRTHLTDVPPRGDKHSTPWLSPDERLKETEEATVVQRDEDRAKRSSGQEWQGSDKQSSRRVKTGDTILNIRGAVRDAIGDAGAAGTAGAAGGTSRIDAFVIRPEPAPRPHTHTLNQQPSSQPPKTEREVLVEPHSRALIPCDLVNVTKVRWYKDNEQITFPSPGIEAIEGGIVIARATRADAALWRCAGVNTDGATLTGKPARLMIYEPVRSVYLAVDGRRLDAGNTWVPVRDKTVLEVRCVAEGGVPRPEVRWGVSGVQPAVHHRPYLRIHHTNYSLEGVTWSPVVVTAARELHNATLSCAAAQRAPPDSGSTAEPMTAKLEIHVTYPPSFVISRWPGFGVSLWAGGAAALRCDVDANPPARAFWFRDDAHTTSSPPPLEPSPEPGGSATLRWGALRPQHAGWYRCRATWLHTEYSSIGYYLNVLSPEDGQEVPREAESQPLEEEVPHQKVDVQLGGNVQLHCPKGSVGCWWRRAAVAGNGTDGWVPAGSQHAHGVLSIKEALYQEGGEYRCVGARAGDVRLRDLKRVTLRVTGGATATALSAEPAGGGGGGGGGGWRLECGACGRGVQVWWLRRPPAPAAAAHLNHEPPLPAKLAPDLAQHCWRAVLHTTDPEEMWCVAVTVAGGAVAVFPARRAPPPSPPAPAASPAPARRALSAHAVPLTPPLVTIAISLAVVACEFPFRSSFSP